MTSESTVPRLHLREDEVIRLVLEFVSNRQLHISQVSQFHVNLQQFNQTVSVTLFCS